MTLFRLAWQSVRFYRRTHLAAVLGIAAAVAVIAGSLLVGSSVRASLADLAGSRTGRATAAVLAEMPFTEALAERVAVNGRSAAPLLSLPGVVQSSRSGRRAANVIVYGVDERFFRFHGTSVPPPAGAEVMLSQDLADELGVGGDDMLLVRVARPTDIPIDSLHGRREDVGRSMRLRYAATLSRQQMGEFSLAPGQGAIRAAFIPLDRLQGDLDVAGRANIILMNGGEANTLPREALTAEDFGLTFTTAADTTSLIVESKSGLLTDGVARSIDESAAAASIPTTSVLTWLANRISSGDRMVPYSLVTALSANAAGDAELASMLKSPAGGAPPIVLNEWAARDLGIAPGAPIELEYYRWADEGRLVTERASFVLAGIVPMGGLAVDRRLAPDYPGITNADTVGDWDPPFPINLKLIRPQDEAYWKEFRTSPKAFIAIETGQKLWRTRHGAVTSIRLLDAAARQAGVAPAIAARIAPTDAGITTIDLAARNASASQGATDFGAYFSYFSFFLMVSALLLAALFFRLAIEQRLPQIGVLRATGFSLSALQRALTIEGLIVAGAGAAAGVALAVAWAALMMFGLRTWWVGAVGTTELRLHVDPWTLAAGAIGGLAAAIVSIWITVRGLRRFTARELLTGATVPAQAGRSRSGMIAIAALAGAAALSALSFFTVIPAAGGFFGAAALVLVAGLAALRAALARPRATTSLASLGLGNMGWRPGRSLTAAGLVAAAAFLLVAVDTFRKDAGSDRGPNSGTGGFDLMAESALPIAHDVSTADGREAVGLEVSDAGTAMFALRLRPGDDASCLNLYRPTQPRVLAFSDRLIEANRFRFARTVGGADDNPWRLLGPPDADGIVPAIVDATSLQYVLHAAVGDVITIDENTARPHRLRIVASLFDSVLQGEIVVSERAFTGMFPDVEGYRVLLVDAGEPAPEQVDALATTIEKNLSAFGVDAQDAVRRLEAFHRVENTYLSTFQALGGLGLLLGAVGLVAVVARNVLERRRELALLAAAGYTSRDLQRVIAIEHAALVAAGLVIGIVAAAVAVAPAALERASGVPWQALIWIAAVAVAGFAAAFLAARAVRRMPILASLRSE